MELASWIYFYARKYDDAVTLVNQALRSDSSDILLQRLTSLQRRVNLNEAMRTASRIRDSKMRSVELLWTDLRMGNKTAGLQLHHHFDTIPNSEVMRARLLVIEGKYDLAIDLLEVGFDQRRVRNGGDDLESLSVHPAYDPLRDHPRFKKLMEKMNYPKLD